MFCDDKGTNTLPFGSLPHVSKTYTFVSFTIFEPLMPFPEPDSQPFRPARKGASSLKNERT